MSWPNVAKALSEGKHVTLRPQGNSMTPIINSGDKITLSPITDQVKIGDVVLAFMGRRRWYVHLVTAVDRNGEHPRYQISNNHGFVNGWTTKIYGRVTKIE